MWGWKGINTVILVLRSVVGFKVGFHLAAHGAGGVGSSSASSVAALGLTQESQPVSLSIRSPAPVLFIYVLAEA